MPSLIPLVKSRLFARATRASMHALDGGHASLLHGRSLDFDELRDYQPGDQVRDIDWRASAKHDTLLVKRMRATRMHTVMFVVDTSRAMAALAADERPKRELSVLAVGALGWLSVRHGDDIALVHGDAVRVTRAAGGRTETALERVLRTVDSATTVSSGPSDLHALLDHVARTVTRRTILVIVADDAPLRDDTRQLVRRLRMQHDMLWVTVADADPVLDGRSRNARTDVETGWGVPDFVHGDASVRAAVAQLDAESERERSAFLDRSEIDHTRLDRQDTAVRSLLSMLERRSRARAR